MHTIEQNHVLASKGYSYSVDVDIDFSSDFDPKSENHISMQENKFKKDLEFALIIV